MKNFLFIIISFTFFIPPINGQDLINRSHYLDNTTRDLTSVAKWLKNSGRGMFDQFYENFMSNRSNLHRIRKTVEMEGVSYNWDFYDSGLLEIKKADNSKTTHLGEWGAINADHIKFHAQSQDKKSEILFYESQTEHLFIQIQNQQSYDNSNINTSKQESTNQSLNESVLRKKRIAAGIDIKSTEGNLSDWRWRPDKCIECKGSGIIKECWNCEKQGYRECFFCNGRQYNKNGTICTRCAGKGVQTCKYCNGKVYNFRCQHWFIVSLESLKLLK